MANNHYSLVVLGGDVHAASIAAFAAESGVRVALVSAGDLGEDSSKNFLTSHNANLSKLEALSLYEVGRNIKEERILCQLAPHWAQSTLYYLVQKQSVRSASRVEWGLSLLKRISTPIFNPPAPPFNPVTPLKNNEGILPYWGCRLNEQRLTIAYAKTLRHYGGRVLTRAAVDHCERKQQWVLRVNNKTVTADAMVNCSGRDSLTTLKTLGVNTRCNIITHPQTTLFVPKSYPGEHGYILQKEDRQLIFVAPINSQCLAIGPIRASGESAVTELIDLYNATFAPQITRDEVLHVHTIARPLYEDPTANTPNYLPNVLLDLNNQSSQPPLLNLFGTDPAKHRLFAERALTLLRPFIPLQTVKHAMIYAENFVGADRAAFNEELQVAYPKMPLPLLRRLAHTYGEEVYAILANHKTKADLGEHFGAELYAAEVNYLLQNEWARDVDDLLWRRTDLGCQLSPASIKALNSWLTDRRAQILESRKNNSS